MRTAYKVWTGIAAGVFCLVAVTDLAGPATPSAGTVASSASMPATGSAAPASTPLGGVAATSGRVVEVIDGDTFRLASGDEVRVLGIDSCEAATPGGRRATAAARARLLAGHADDVTLSAEPGVDRDPYDRLLRHVTVGGADYASAMVVEDHTGVYTRGRNDASPAVQTTLRRLDTDGRDCGTAAPTTTPTTPRTTVASLPDPDPDLDRPRTPRPAVPRAVAPEASGGGGAAYYKNCAAARAAGAAPIRAGQPGYRAALDRDGDGTACDS